MSDFREAMKWYWAAAHAGDSWGMYSVGNMYWSRGYGQRQDLGGYKVDDIDAKSWFEKSAKSGNSFAMLCLGLMYESGAEGIEIDLDKAMDWYLKSAELGDCQAMDAISYLYRWHKDYAENHNIIKSMYRRKKSCAAGCLYKCD